MGLFIEIESIRDWGFFKLDLLLSCIIQDNYFLKI